MTVEVLRLASAQASPATLHVQAHARRTRAVLELDPVLDELDRRASVGLGVIADRRLLEVLRQLPADIAVPSAGISQETLRVLHAAPAGCVEMADAQVVRRAVPPVRVVRAGVCAATWSEGLRQASQFASYCTRYAVLTRDRFDRERAEMEARFYGIGLATMTDGPSSFVWLVEPEPFRPDAMTVAAWQFTEQALDALCLSTETCR